MLQIRDRHIKLLQSWGNNALMIRETLTRLTNIDVAICSNLQKTEINLIAEFAATYSSEEWAKAEGWFYHKGCFWKDEVSLEDMKSIVEAQKIGAVFKTIKFGSKVGVCFSFPTPFKMEPITPVLVLDGIADDHVKLVVELLKSGLKFHCLQFSKCRFMEIILVLEAITTEVKLKRLELYRNQLEKEVLSRIFHKLKLGGSLQDLEYLCLISCGLTDEDAKMIAKIGAGVPLPVLKLNRNLISDHGATLLRKAFGRSQQEMGIRRPRLLPCWKSEFPLVRPLS